MEREIASRDLLKGQWRAQEMMKIIFKFRHFYDQFLSKLCLLYTKQTVKLSSWITGGKVLIWEQKKIVKSYFFYSRNQNKKSRSLPLQFFWENLLTLKVYAWIVGTHFWNVKSNKKLFPVFSLQTKRKYAHQRSSGFLTLRCCLSHHVGVELLFEQHQAHFIALGWRVIIIRFFGSL